MCPLLSLRVGLSVCALVALGTGQNPSISGAFESANEQKATGWGYDTNQGYNPVRVRICEGATTLVERPACVFRSGLAASQLGRHHGFDIALPPLGPGAHALTAKVLDSVGTPQSIGVRTITVSYQSPGGCIETLVAGPTTVTIAGWAFDANAGTAPIYITIQQDGTPVRGGLANLPDATLVPALGSSQHRFSITFPRPTPGIHVYAAWGTNFGPGQDRMLPSLVPLVLDLRDNLASLGSKLPGATSTAWTPQDGTFRFTFNDGIDQRQYVVNPNDTAVLRGAVVVSEAISGTTPAYRLGTSRLRLNGSVIYPASLVQDPSNQVIRDPIDFDGSTLSMRYTETFEGATRVKSVSYALQGKTLVIDVKAGSSGPSAALGGYRSLYPGDTFMPAARSLVIPYTAEPVLVGPGVFVSCVIDRTLSNGNKTYLEGPTAVTWPSAGIHHHRTIHYEKDSFGSVQPLSERVYLTVSSAVQDTFAATNAAAPRTRANVADRVVYDTWSLDRQPLDRDPWLIPFSEQASHFMDLAQTYGLSRVIVLRHNWGSNYEHAQPKYFPANPNAGGDSGFASLSSTVRQQGWLFAAHEDPSAMHEPNPISPTTPWFDPSAISRNADLNFRSIYSTDYFGSTIPWYAVLPDRLPAYAALHSDYLATTYGNNAAFWDIQGYHAPILTCDGGNTTSKTYEQGIRLVKQAASVLRNRYSGPLFSESYANPETWALAYAGSFDGLERELPGGESGLVIPDFELRVVQPVQVNQGMGYHGRFFSTATRDSPEYPGETHFDFIRSRAIAYGHTGFISDTLDGDPRLTLGLGGVPHTEPRTVFPRDQILKEYYLFQALQSQMFAGRVASILYWDGGVFKTLSAKLLELRSASASEPAFLALVEGFFHGPRMAIAYENGLEVRVNCDTSADWIVTLNGTTYTLPPSGWAAVRASGGETFEAYTARMPGSQDVVSYVRSSSYTFHDYRAQNLLLISNGTTLAVPY